MDPLRRNMVMLALALIVCAYLLWWQSEELDDLNGRVIELEQERRKRQTRRRTTTREGATA